MRTELLMVRAVKKVAVGLNAVSGPSSMPHCIMNLERHFFSTASFPLFYLFSGCGNTSKDVLWLFADYPTTKRVSEFMIT